MMVCLRTSPLQTIGYDNTNVSTNTFSLIFFVKGTAKSTRGYNCVPLFVSDKGCVYVVLMISKKFVRILSGNLLRR